MTSVIPLELTIVVVAQAHNPSILNPDFLKFNKIVPDDWELSGDPICAGPVSQVAYTSGVTVFCQADRLSFSEVLSGKEKSSVPEIVSRYVGVLEHVDYKQLGINSKVFAGLSKEEVEGAVLASQLAPTAAWAKAGHGLDLKTVSLKFSYQMSESEVLNLSIDEGALTEDLSEKKHGVLFGANFHNMLRGENYKERLQDLLAALATCQNRVDILHKLATGFIENYDANS